MKLGLLSIVYFNYVIFFLFVITFLGRTDRNNFINYYNIKSFCFNKNKKSILFLERKVTIY